MSARAGAGRPSSAGFAPGMRVHLVGAPEPLGTVTEVDHAEGLIYARWDGLAFTESEHLAAELVQVPGSGDASRPFGVLMETKQGGEGRE